MKFRLIYFCLTYLVFSACWATDLTAQDQNSSTVNILDIFVDTDKVSSEVYRFWDVRVVTNQMDFITLPLAAIKSQNPYARTVNCVRLLGGRTDSLNLWFKGVDSKGNIRTDFTDLVRILKTMTDGGITPYLVLDNVPAEMSDGIMNFYGNCKPPKDYNLWRQYIGALMKTLLSEFRKDEVRKWQFRVGTEPDLFPNHWNGTREEYFRHYDITVDEVTKALPDAIIGPGNILNPTNKFWIKGSAATVKNDELTDVVGTANGWGLSLIDHAAKGTNYATDKQGTKMSFFGISYYDAVGGKRPILLDKAAEIVRERLNRYPETKNIPLSVQEFGILHDEKGKRLYGNDNTEWGASWYAAISDIIYKKNIQKAYEWNTTTWGVPHPRTQVIRMLEMMAGGKRIDVPSVNTGGNNSGALACLKDGKIYILLYNHYLAREGVMKNMILKLRGKEITASNKWHMNEWSIDKEHGTWIYEMYADFAKAGLQPDPKAPIYDGNPRERYGGGWRPVFEKNKEKYMIMADSIVTEKNKPIQIKNGTITMNLILPGHGVKLIELIPGM